MKYNDHLGFLLIVTLIPIIFNFANSLYAINISPINIIATSFFLIAWLIYGVRCGLKFELSFLIFAFVLWGIAITLGIGYLISKIESFLLYHVFFLFLPMYPIEYYFRSIGIQQPTDMFILPIPIMVVSIIGFTIGVVTNRIKGLRKI